MIIDSSNYEDHPALENAVLDFMKTAIIRHTMGSLGKTNLQDYAAGAGAITGHLLKSGWTFNAPD